MFGHLKMLFLSLRRAFSGTITSSHVNDVSYEQSYADQTDFGLIVSVVIIVFTHDSCRGSGLEKHNVKRW